MGEVWISWPSTEPIMETVPSEDGTIFQESMSFARCGSDISSALQMAEHRQTPDRAGLCPSGLMLATGVVALGCIEDASPKASSLGRLHYCSSMKGHDLRDELARPVEVRQF